VVKASRAIIVGECQQGFDSKRWLENTTGMERSLKKTI